MPQQPIKFTDLLSRTLYKSSHHADTAFYRAIEFEATAHHGQFWNMPALPSVSKVDAAEIISYIRAVQHANGIS